MTPSDHTYSGTTAGTTTFTALHNVPGIYKMYITRGGGTTTHSTNLVMSVTVTGTSTLADTNGTGQTALTVPFDRSSAVNSWIFIGYLTNSEASPTIHFGYLSGTVANDNRWNMDAVRFESMDTCTGVADQVGAGGPLAAGQTFVNVTGVAQGATNVTAYANNTFIGETNYAAGFAAGTVTVPTSALNKDDVITAGQSKRGCSSTVPGSGPVVGGGANPSIKVLLSCYQNAANVGPIAANGFIAGNPYILKASSFIANFNTAPIPGQQLVPGACWQTVTFQHGVDPAIDMNSGTAVVDGNRFCALDALVFSMDNTDSGPYDIYVDQIMNGNTVVEDFESYADGSTNTIMAPNQAGVFAPAAAYLNLPNSATISAVAAYDGTKSCRIQWQWANASANRWGRAVASGASGGKAYPQLDTTQPITIRYLILPAGVTTPHKFNGTVSQITGHTPAYDTATNTLSVTVTGSGAYTYQWSWNGSDVYDATTRSLVLGDNGGVNSSLNGTYAVTVSDGTCTETRSALFDVLPPAPTITNQPGHGIISAGATAAVMSVGADGHVAMGYPLSYQWRFNGGDLPDQTTAALWITNATLANVGEYDVLVSNSYGSTNSVTNTLAVVPVGVIAGTGTGLRGDYRTAHYSTNAFSGAPSLTRTDAVVAFDWGTGVPAPGIAADNFTARWTGQVQALGTDTYTFYTVTDDGVRLWVNGQSLVNNWTLHAPTTNSASLDLTGTTQYDVTLEFFESGSGAVAKLYWSTASGSIGFEPVPMTQLFPAPAGTVIPPFTFTQSDATNLVFSWGVGQYNLAWATDVAGPYDNIIYGVTSPYTNTIGSEPTKFFRLQVE